MVVSTNLYKSAKIQLILDTNKLISTNNVQIGAIKLNVVGEYYPGYLHGNFKLHKPNSPYDLL